MRRRLLSYLCIPLIFLSACTGSAVTQSDAASTEIPSAAETSAIGEESDSQESTETKESPDQEAEPQETLRAIPVSILDHYNYLDVPEEENIWIWTDYCELRIDEEGHENLQDALDALTEKTADIMQEDMNTYDEWIRENGTADDEEYLQYYDQTLIRISRADTRVVSFLNTWVSDTGGAHANSWYEPHTLDTASGKELLIYDVVDDTDALPDLIEQRFLEKYGEECLIIDSVSEMVRNQVMQDGSDKASQVLKYTLGSDRITFWFSPYEAANYATGGIELEFLFDEYPDLVKKEYQEPAVNRIDALPEGETYQTAAGMAVKWESVPLDDDAYQINLKITRGEREDVLETWAYSANGYIVHAGDTELLAVQASSDNDYQLFYLINLDPDNLQDAVQYNEHFPSVNPTCSDPIRLGRRGELLSTYSTDRLYRFTEEGGLEPLESWYTIRSFNFALTSLQEITVNEVSEESGESIGQKTVPAGSTYRFLRTDNESWVDMTLEDGSIVRLTIDHSEWPVTVNGIDMEELFEDMIFAG